MSTRRTSRGYVVCVKDGGYRASLIARRIYRVLPDAEADKRRLLRVIDESGEDYLYPATLFVAIDLPRGAKQLFAKASSNTVLQRTARAEAAAERPVVRRIEEPYGRSNSHGQPGDGRRLPLRRDSLHRPWRTDGLHDLSLR